jgi:adenylate cyclase
LEELLTEARAAAALDHPFICSIYEVTALNDRPCIAMEYVRGETLERRLRRGPLSLTDGLRAVEETAEALEAAHQRRVIHSDLKPANVMLTADHHIKVMDFGLATRLPVDDFDHGITGRLVSPDDVVVRGTPAYMAPEQIRGEPLDRRSDIFSFGILAYELLCGRNPFVRTGADATLVAILGEPVQNLHDLMPAIPTALSGVVARMLAKDPAARYQSFGDIRKELRRVAIGLTASAVPAAFVVVDHGANDASTTLIGRDAERAQLLDSINQAASDRGTLIVLSGDAGIGKTRLVEEALEAARRRGCLTFVGRCYEQHGTPAMIPYIEVLEDASRLLPGWVFQQTIGPSAPELAKLLPELYRLFPDMPPPLELPPELRQRFLFTNIREFLTRCSTFTPLVIVVDDLQWADESTLQMTQHLAQYLSTLPIVVIAVYRDVEITPAAAKSTFQNLFDRWRGQTGEVLALEVIKTTLSQLVSQGRARSIALRPFTEADVHRMLAALANDDPPAAVARKFFDQTGGNPFFVAELFRHLKEEGRLFGARDEWKHDVDFDDVVVPESVRVVLERRLQRLSTETQKVLRAAAVIGTHFELDLLEAVAEVDDETLFTALDEAERARLVKGPSGRQDVTWRFAHQLICQTLTQAIPRLRREKLHLQVAAEMERCGTPSHVYTSEIAHHLYSAGRMADAGRTARALMTAGDAAHAVYATQEAVQHYRRALDLLKDRADEKATRLGVEERLADLLAFLGDRDAAMKHYETLAREHDPSAPSDQARVARKVGTLHWQGGDRSQAMASYRRALEAVDGTGAHLEAAHLYQELGLAAFRSGDNAQAIAWAERALQSAEVAVSDAASATPDVRRAATAAIAHATNTIGVALARSGELDAARERIERSAAAAREFGLLDVACRAYANLGVLYSTVEPKRAIDVSLTGLELASKIGATSLQSYLYANLAAAYCALTDRCETEGLQAAQAAANLDRRLGQLDHLAVPLVVIAQIHQCRGELQQAQQYYSEALALAERAGEPQLILPCYDGLATICLDRGDRIRAAEYMEKAQTLCIRTGLDPDTLLLLPFLA